MTDGEKVVQKRRFTQKDFANEILSGQSLHIARVPKDTKTWFKTLAAKDFNDDYGLMWICLFLSVLIYKN